ncbi:hypothetical protein C4J89_1129 [Pseudomonas sp. R4-35-07]|nr:hypothetical protein C4J91_1200 [Pseudomonas sp. R3-52-08]AZF25296.1 hypothetical protein C4J90_1107 [Pseudomonas sp. R2-60-08W]AZF30620.1 hypothetical protein C4J89_1129 [Pseudomonas sp. R4-35-07]AZF46465.1 hypothetical protein C4J86_1214 [Pseudomonas sp. R2-7-07]
MGQPALPACAVSVGGGLPPIAVCQSVYLSLIYRYRGQAPSHIGPVSSVDAL